MSCIIKIIQYIFLIQLPTYWFLTSLSFLQYLFLRKTIISFFFIKSVKNSLTLYSIFWQYLNVNTKKTEILWLNLIRFEASTDLFRSNHCSWLNFGEYLIYIEKVEDSSKNQKSFYRHSIFVCLFMCNHRIFFAQKSPNLSHFLKLS